MLTIDNFTEPKDHPKAERLWELAWDQGYSNGYSQVALEADRLVELL